MLTMFEKNNNVFVSVILFLVVNLETCYGNHTCYQLSSGKDICFMFDGIKRTFEGSKQFCQNNGRSLLEIYNNEMQQLVEQFVKDVKTYFGEAWLNLVRTSSDEWVWGSEPYKILSYSNWEGVTPASYYSSINQAFMNSNYKWMNSYDPHNASTICFQENKRTYKPETSTTSPTTTTTQKPQGTPTEGANKSSSTTSKSTSPSSTTTTTVSSLSSQASLPSPSSSSTTTTTSMKANHATPANSESSSSAAIGIGVGVGLGGLVLIIVSSLLIAKFVFHKKIPLPFKSSTSRKSLPHETGSDVINGAYEQIEDNKLTEKSPYAEVIMSDASNLPPNSNLNYMGFQDLIQPNSDAGIEGLSKADYGTPQTFGKNIYDNAV